VQNNKYASLPNTHYPIVKDQITERIDALQQAIDSVRESMEGQIKLLEQQKTEALQDLEFIKSGM
jgi:glutamate racemase